MRVKSGRDRLMLLLVGLGAQELFELGAELVSGREVPDEEGGEA